MGSERVSFILRNPVNCRRKQSLLLKCFSRRSKQGIKLDWIWGIGENTEIFLFPLIKKQTAKNVIKYHSTKSVILNFLNNFPSKKNSLKINIKKIPLSTPPQIQVLHNTTTTKQNLHSPVERGKKVKTGSKVGELPALKDTFPT